MGVTLAIRGPRRLPDPALVSPGTLFRYGEGGPFPEVCREVCHDRVPAYEQRLVDHLAVHVDVTKKPALRVFVRDSLLQLYSPALDQKAVVLKSALRQGGVLYRRPFVRNLDAQVSNAHHPAVYLDIDCGAINYLGHPRGGEGAGLRWRL